MRTNQKVILPSLLMAFLLINTGCMRQERTSVKVEIGSVNVPDQIVIDTGSTVVKEKLTTETILMSDRYFTSLVIFDEVLLSKEQIKVLLDNNDGLLKSYKEIVTTASGDKEYTGKNILMSFFEGFTAPDGGGGIDSLPINMNVFIFLLELKWHLITSNELTGEELKEKLSQLVYQDFVVGSSMDKSLAQKDTLKEILEDLGFLMYEFYYEYPEKKTITFQDGSTLEASDKINKATYVIQKITAKMADNQEEWEMWFSEGENSFNNLWNRFWSSNNLETKFRYEEY